VKRIWRFVGASLMIWSLAMNSCAQPRDSILCNDVHFHLTNYIQKGTPIKDFLQIMGNKVGRVALFGIPLQQQWAYNVTGDFAPRYYLDTDAPLYYYSFTDAMIAMAYASLNADQKKRFEPMITGFNPTDMWATDHIRRVLLTFPNTFTGIGEFTIHKEFVSSKIAGGVASLKDHALDSIYDFAAESGLVVLMHSDINNPFPKSYTRNYLSDMRDLFRRHPKTTIIWAHCGLGRIVTPITDQVKFLEDMLDDPSLSHVNFDISWDEVAKYFIQSPKATELAAAMINKYPDRFLLGSDEVAPTTQAAYLKVYNMYAPLWKLLTAEASEKVRKKNFDRIFDAAKVKVRAWEKANAGKQF
jgi:amidohydrolase family protein